MNEPRKPEVVQVNPVLRVSDPGPMLRSGEWDDLLARSRSNTVFLTSAWLRASQETDFSDCPALASVASIGSELVAGVILVQRRRLLELLGTGSSDYLDVVIDRSLDAEQATRCTRALLSEALKAAPGARDFLLRHIPDDGGTPARLELLGQGWWVTRLNSIEAPTMEMWAAQEAVKKKSLRRHETVLAREGALTTVRLNRAEDVLERLPLFFDQHIRRWANTPHPSLFLVPRRQEFYRLLVRNLSESGSLRYTELRLDGRMVAAHLGAYYEGRFTWYKPTFEPDLAKLSPGEVLLKRLIEQAEEEGAREFDFTIGDEAFKKRFATRVRTVTDMHVTQSPISALMLRSRRACRSLARAGLRQVGLWEPIKRTFRPHR